ncbi:unnamed protein product [Diabrotica balteata]|uniref:Uncharacterized protein n=1 Tax=Diabrotica balteata TaxID=107213 RepID=A0A9N9T581_DIABA|nr:unnamed protein product [Diabrotica balteata]
MKFTIAFLVLALAFCAYAQEEQAPLSPEQVVDLVKEKNPNLACINLECRLSCRNQGYKSGYCAAGISCTCVGPLAA